MSLNPDTPEYMHPLAPGYSPRQAELDAEMVVLGRPALTVRQALSPALLAAHRANVEQWEYANPDAAVRWLELRTLAAAEEAKLYAERYGPEAYQFEQMRAVGFRDVRALEAVRMANKVPLFETPPMKSAREWTAKGLQWCLVLSGRPGCGKTLASTWAAHQLLTRGFAPRCVPCLKASEASLYGGEAEEYRWRCAQAGVLVLDDLGEGEQRQEKRAAWRAWVDDVLTQRHAVNRRTIVTTNRTPAELGAWLGARLADRINEGVVTATAAPSLREPGSDG